MSAATAEGIDIAEWRVHAGRSYYSTYQTIQVENTTNDDAGQSGGIESWSVQMTMHQRERAPAGVSGSKDE